MELSFGEMLMIALAIVVLFGPDKLPEIARGLGQGVRRMRGAVDDIKTEIMKEADNPVSEIKKEIDKVKQSVQDYNPMNDIKKSVSLESEKPETLKVDPLSDEHEGPVSR
ncbi:twin-arginine translocase TatA/TatE family subunit [Soonwooa sp.]|uniref:Sec-independent protein translocase subunit TatA/TatB n=1 Tax=Soonwooa sp. TaxID=1938592 RepID=UPI0035B16E29